MDHQICGRQDRKMNITRVLSPCLHDLLISLIRSGTRINRINQPGPLRHVCYATATAMATPAYPNLACPEHRLAGFATRCVNNQSINQPTNQTNRSQPITPITESNKTQSQTTLMWPVPRGIYRSGSRPKSKARGPPEAELQAKHQTQFNVTQAGSAPNLTWYSGE